MKKASEVNRQAQPPRQQQPLNSQNRAPLYHQIFLIMRSKIFDGEYGPGALLPGERELGEMFNVSRITAVRALNELALSGLVIRERGRGTRVQFVGSGTVARGPLGNPEPLPPSMTVGTTQDSFDKLRDHAKSEVTVYEFEYMVPPASVAGHLDLREGKPVQYVTRVWKFDGVPFNHITTYVPEDIGRNWTRKDLEKVPLGDLLEGCGIEFGMVRERITATLADITLSERLDVAVGSPLIKITRTTYERGGRPVEHMFGFYPPDRYQYEVTLPVDRPGRRTVRSRRR